MKTNDVVVRVTGVPDEKAAAMLITLTLMRFGDEMGDCGAYINECAKGVTTFICDNGFEKILIKEIEYLNNYGANMTCYF